MQRDQPGEQHPPETALTDRQSQILALVRAQGFASIEELAQRFALTPQTLRRDVNALSRAGLLQRHHGGAGLPVSVANFDYRDRRVQHLDAKRRIARLVAGRLPNDASVILNIGTTTEEVARALLHHRGLRVITNSLNVANILAGRPETEVIIAGGTVRPGDRGITGEATIDFLRQFRVDYAVIGISGIAPDGTLLDFDFHEVRVSQVILEVARTVWLAADASKLGRRAFVRLADVSELDALFTDEPPPEPFARVLADAGIEVHVAPPGPGASERRSA